MDYSLVKEIATTENWEHANKYLAAGWVLLNIHTTAYDTEPPGCAHQTEHFTLGWKDDGEPNYPDLSYHYKHYSPGELADLSL